MSDENRFGAIVGSIGAILIALGVAWLIAQNWHQIPWPLKIIILALATGASFIGGIKVREKGYQKTAGTLFGLGALLYTLSVFLISQIFSTNPTLQGFTWLLLLAWAGNVAAAYLLRAHGPLIIALIEMLVWVMLQWLALYDRHSYDPAWGLLALSFLALGVLFYGLNLWHRHHDHTFVKAYRIFTVVYLLLFSYVLSFQAIQPVLWEGTGLIHVYVLLAVLGLVALLAVITGMQRQEVDKRELYGFGGICVLLLSVIFFASLTTGTPVSWSSRGATPILWAAWMYAAIIFVVVILAVIGYGTLHKDRQIINIGIFFFGLMVLTRYLGFMMDLWGYTSLALVFITGGGILLFGGWAIEKWRRKLLQDVS